MADDAKVEIIGAVELVAKLQNTDALFGVPFRQSLDHASVVILTEVQTRTKVDTGLLRASMFRELDPSPVPLWAKVGTRVEYAKEQEFGTGVLSDAPDSGHAAYFPPGAALDVWAKRHGIKGGGWAVARGIHNRGGTKPVRMLRDGLQAAKSEVIQILNAAMKNIQQYWSSK